MNNYIYILIMAGVTFLIRVLPLLLIKGKIRNSFIRSFLYYTPYATLAVMTFPAIIDATGNYITGSAALAAGILAAWLGLSMYKVAICCCAVVLILGFII